RVRGPRIPEDRRSGACFIDADFAAKFAVMNLDRGRGVEKDSVDFGRDPDRLAGLVLLRKMIRFVEVSSTFEAREGDVGDVADEEITVEAILEMENLVGRGIGYEQLHRQRFGDGD